MARNSISEQITEIGSRTGAVFADVAHLASGARGRQQVLRLGDVEGGMWWAGQAQGLIDDIDTCENVVRRIAEEAEDIIVRRLPAHVE